MARPELPKSEAQKAERDGVLTEVLFTSRPTRGPSGAL